MAEGPDWKPAVPMLILIGGDDDWTPAPPCHGLSSRFPGELPWAHYDFGLEQQAVEPARLARPECNTADPHWWLANNKSTAWPAAVATATDIRKGIASLATESVTEPSEMCGAYRLASVGVTLDGGRCCAGTNAPTTVRSSHVRVRRSRLRDDRCARPQRRAAFHCPEVRRSGLAVEN